MRRGMQKTEEGAQRSQSTVFRTVLYIWRGRGECSGYYGMMLISAFIHIPPSPPLLYTLYTLFTVQKSVSIWSKYFTYHHTTRLYSQNSQLRTPDNIDVVLVFYSAHHIFKKLNLDIYIPSFFKCQVAPRPSFILSSSEVNYKHVLFITFKGMVSRDFQPLVFFHESNLSSPPIHNLKPFRIQLRYYNQNIILRSGLQRRIICFTRL